MVQNGRTSRLHLLQMLQQVEGLVAVKGLLAGPKEEAVSEDVPGEELVRVRKKGRGGEKGRGERGGGGEEGRIKRGSANTVQYV